MIPGHPGKAVGRIMTEEQANLFRKGVGATGRWVAREWVELPSSALEIKPLRCEGFSISRQKRGVWVVARKQGKRSALFRSVLF